MLNSTNSKKGKKTTTQNISLEVSTPNLTETNPKKNIIEKKLLWMKIKLKYIKKK